MKARVSLALKCFAVIAMCTASSTVFAYEGEDDASNYTNSWASQNGGSGFDYWMKSDLGNVSQDLIDSAAGYGGDAATMDTAGKCFVLNIPGRSNPTFSPLEISRAITTTKADGMKFKIRMQCLIGSVSLGLGRASGRFGRIRNLASGWDISHGNGSTNVDLDKFAPVEMVITTYGSSGKWNVSMRNLLTQQVRTYTGLDAELGSGQLDKFSFIASSNSQTTETILFNSLMVDPTGGYSKVKGALDY